MDINTFKKSLLLCAAALSSFACQETPVEPELPTTGDGVSFTSSISAASKVADNHFELGDEIGVSAYESTDLNAAVENNVVYEFNASDVFVSETPIQYASVGAEYVFRAVYPYQSTIAGNEFDFDVLADQSNEQNYMVSDLLTAETDATSDEKPLLSFYHRLSGVVVDIVSSDVSLDDAVVKITNVKTAVEVDLAANTFSGVSETSDVVALDKGEGIFAAVVAPQALTQGTDFISIVAGGVEVTAPIVADVELISGHRYIYEAVIEQGELTFTGRIVDWEDDELFDNGGGEDPDPEPEFVVFKDAKFKEALLTKSTGDQTDYFYTGHIPQTIDVDGDGEISFEEAADVYQIGIENKGITDLSGIEHFTGLGKILAKKNNFSTFDVSKNTELEYVDFSYMVTPLTAADFTNNPELYMIKVHANAINAIDLSKNTKLQYLWVSDNNLSELSLENNSLVTEVLCDGNNLSTIDITPCFGLEYLVAYDNNFTTLNLTQNVALKTVSVANNPLNALDLTASAALENLSVEYTDITALDLSKNAALKQIYVRHNKLAALDISKNAALEVIYCNANNMTALDMTNNPALYQTFCGMQTDASGADQTLTLTITQDQLDSNYFDATATENVNVVTEVPGAGGSEDPDDPYVGLPKFTLATIPDKGTEIEGDTWVITDASAVKGDFGKLATCLDWAGREITVIFSELAEMPLNGFDSWKGANLVSIQLPKATKINQQAFNMLGSLKEIYAPKAVTASQYAIYSCQNLEKLTLCVGEAAVNFAATFINGVNKANITLYTSPESVTGIAIDGNLWCVPGTNPYEFKAIEVVE